jgi:membrane fusion protein, multidrug efflux system
MAVSTFLSSGSKNGLLSVRLKWILGLVVGIALVVVGWHLVGGWLNKKPRTAPPPPVSIARARLRSVTVSEHTIATVVSPATVQVNAQVAGKLLQAFFREGQIVHKGDPLFQIDPAPFQNALTQARATLAKDQAQAAALSRDEQRYVALYAAGAASQQARDQAVAAAAGARATVQSDTAAVATATENLGYTHISAPIDGKTGPILVQPGNLVTVAGTSLVSIAQVQPIKVSFFLPQNELAQIQDQMAQGRLIATVTIPGAQALRAKVDFISNIVNAATGTIELRATFPNDDMRLVPGQSVTVSVSLRDIPNAVVVPRDAVNAGPDGSYVDVVRPDSVAVVKPVTVLNDDGTFDAIKGDVKPGDRVITDGQLRVVPGAKVAIGGRGSGRGGGQGRGQGRSKP